MSWFRGNGLLSGGGLWSPPGTRVRTQEMIEGRINMYCSRILILLVVVLATENTPRPASSLLSRHYPAVNHVPKSFAPRSAKSYLKCQGHGARQLKNYQNQKLTQRISAAACLHSISTIWSAQLSFASPPVPVGSKERERGWAGPPKFILIFCQITVRNINSPMTKITTLFYNPNYPKTYKTVISRGNYYPLQ